MRAGTLLPIPNELQYTLSENAKKCQDDEDSSKNMFTKLRCYSPNANNRYHMQKDKPLRVDICIFKNITNLVAGYSAGLESYAGWGELLTTC